LILLEILNLQQISYTPNSKLNLEKILIPYVIFFYLTWISLFSKNMGWIELFKISSHIKENHQPNSQIGYHKIWYLVEFQHWYLDDTRINAWYPLNIDLYVASKIVFLESESKFLRRHVTKGKLPTLVKDQMSQYISDPPFNI
jgi:hypothetical protein